jgi:hypothetical protein
VLLQLRDAVSVLLALRVENGSRNAMGIHRDVPPARVSTQLVSEYRDISKSVD